MGRAGSSRTGRGSPDPAAAENALAVIEDGGLTRRDRPRWDLEDQIGLAGARGGVEGCRHRRLGGSQLSSHRYTGDGERMPAEPVQLPEREPGLGESRSRPDYDAALL